MLINIDPIAAYAAIISTCTLAWLIWKEMPKVKIDVLNLDKKGDKYSLHVSVINRTHYPMKLESYGVDYVSCDKHKRSFSILVSETDRERILPKRDNIPLILDLTLLRRDDKIRLKSFFILDSTYHQYSKKIPVWIVHEFTK